MLPHCKRDSQFELFDGEIPSLHATPQIELPVQRHKEVDVQRVANILAVSQKTVRRMLDDKLLRAYRHSPCTAWIIEYDSVVEYCNHLRVLYLISSDRLLCKPARGRLRDADLLPFPIEMTVTPEQVQERLGISRHKVIALIEQGDLVGYQIIALKGSPYRIHAPSVDRYIASLHSQTERTPRLRTTSSIP